MARQWWISALSLLACTETAAPDAGTHALAAIQRADRCAEVVPEAVRRSQLPGWEEHAPERLGGRWVADPVVCAFSHQATGAELTITADCRLPAKEREIEAVREAVLEGEGAEVTGLGRAAVRAKATGALEQLTAWDDDSACTFTVTWHGEGREQALELIRQLITPPVEPAALPEQPAPEAADGGTAPVLAPALLEP